MQFSKRLDLFGDEIFAALNDPVVLHPHNKFIKSTPFIFPH